MEWLVAPDGTFATLSAAQALSLDIRANMEDLATAIDELAEVAGNSRRILAESSRQQRLRTTRLRAVPAAVD